MTKEVKNIGLDLEEGPETKFKEWREKIGSNMEKMNTAIASKQDVLTGQLGQVVGFDEDGKAVAQSPDALVELKGEDGQSAYEYAIAGGYTGTEDEFKELMGSGPWLPAKNRVILGSIRVGSKISNGKIILDSYFGLDPVLPFEDNYNGSSKQVILATSSNENVIVDGKLEDFVRGLEISGCKIINFNSAYLRNIKTPYLNTDAATKKYVDDAKADVLSAVSAVSESSKINKILLTANGPISENGTFSLLSSNLEVNPCEGSTIFFGPSVGPKDFWENEFPFEMISCSTMPNIEPGNITYNVSITMKALTAIPEGTSVSFLWIWV